MWTLFLHVLLPFPILLASLLLKCLALAATWEKTRIILTIFGPQSEIGAQTEVQWAGHQPWGCCVTAEMVLLLDHSQRGGKMASNGNVLGCSCLVLLMRWDVLAAGWCWRCLWGVTIGGDGNCKPLCLTLLSTSPTWLAVPDSLAFEIVRTCISKRRKTSNLDLQLGLLFTQENSNLKNVINRIHTNAFILPSIVSCVLCCSKEIREMTLCSSTGHWIPHSHSQMLPCSISAQHRAAYCHPAMGVCSLVLCKCASLFLIPP